MADAYKELGPITNHATLANIGTKTHDQIDTSLDSLAADARLIETRTDLTATNATTSTLNLNLGRAFKISASALAAGNAFTIAFSNVPAGAMITTCTVLLVTGTNIPTVTWPTGVTAPALIASKTAWFTLATSDNGTNWRIFPNGSF